MLKKLFGKQKTKAPKGFYEVHIQKIEKLTEDTVKVTLEIPGDLQSKFAFEPGQYINFAIDVDGKSLRRSYSICSGPGDAISVAVKRVENGTVSVWFNNTAQEGQTVLVSTPEGNFTRPKTAQSIVAVAAGSGITPIMSMAKAAENDNTSVELFYGSRTEKDIIFKSELDQLTKTTVHHYLSGEQKDGFNNGRITKESFTEVIKANLELLKADGFFLCGPEQLIVDVAEVLKLFGVPEEKVHYELFTTPVLLASKTETTSGEGFEGVSKMTVLLDDEEIKLELDANGPAILDAVNDMGYDAPYSCKGAVCCTCKAKVLEGKATMKLNYSLTDNEVEEGYILTCQAHPASEEVKITYDV